MLLELALPAAAARLTLTLCDAATSPDAKARLDVHYHIDYSPPALGQPYTAVVGAVCDSGAVAVAQTAAASVVLATPRWRYSPQRRISVDSSLHRSGDKRGLLAGWTGGLRHGDRTQLDASAGGTGDGAGWECPLVVEASALLGRRWHLGRAVSDLIGSNGQV